MVRLRAVQHLLRIPIRLQNAIKHTKKVDTGKCRRTGMMVGDMKTKVVNDLHGVFNMFHGTISVTASKEEQEPMRVTIWMQSKVFIRVKTIIVLHLAKKFE